MALDFQKIDITLGTLDEGTASKRSLPGELDLCENATFPKAGRIDKRLGYALVSVSAEVDGTAIDPANVFTAVASAWNTCMVFGHDTLYVLVDREGQVGDGALVSIGPTLRGNAEIIHIATAQLSD